MVLLQEILQDRFRAGLFALLIALFLLLTFFSEGGEVVPEKELLKPKAVIEVFYSPQCPHCRKGMVFLEELKSSYPNLQIKAHNITVQQELDLMLLYAAHHKLPPHGLGTPLFITGDKYLIGFHETETTGAVIEEWIRQELSGQKIELSEDEETKTDKQTLEIPILGEISLFETSLPLLAVVLGLVDGFNPCAMWVLVYLISLIVGLHDRTKIYTLVGTFLMASGILYFLFMTAWLNVFLYIGYIHALTVAIGLAALGMGVLSMRAFFASGGQLVCKVGDIQSRQKTQSKIRELVSSPLSWASFAGIVALAFAVNSIEFVCSSAMPAIFTHVLTVADISVISYYLYILLYVAAFMFDDFIIFMTAALAVERFAGEKYVGFCKLFGGVLMVALGIVLAFFPQVLR